jgi:ribose-phosphate pyrophosphokinase
MDNLINFSDLKIDGLKPAVIDFPDGEFKLALEELTENKVYFILVQTDKSSFKNIFATAMLIDIVKQKNPLKIVVIHPWLTFSRQDRRFMELEPLTIEILLNFYLELGVTDLVSCDIHTIQFREPGIHKYTKNNRQMTIHNVNIISSFYNEKFELYSVVSPTGEDEPFLKPLRENNVPITYFKKEKWCNNCDKPLQVCLCGEKSLPDYRIVSDKSIFKDKNVFIVDDIIAGGGTILSTVKELKKAGVKDIIIAVTHGFFNNIGNAKELIDYCSEIYVSNTVKIPDDIKKHVKVMDVSTLLLNYIQTTFHKLIS